MLDARPEILIIGTGYSGVMKVPKETIDHIVSRGVEVKVKRTGKAVDELNSLQDKKKVIAALYLTC